MNLAKSSVVILPHLDDEFALVPLIKELIKSSRSDFRIIFCAERNIDAEKKKKQRRHENISSMKLLGVPKKNIIYLNDFFRVDDLKLWKSSNEIYYFLKNMQDKLQFEQILTLNFEGGHPDHDALSLIVKTFSEKTI